MTGKAPVIVTRAEPGASETMKRLEALRIVAILSPMLELVGTDELLPPLTDVSGLLFTSANGVRFFARQSDRRDIAAWCVGPATFEAARSHGFLDCKNADGDGLALAAHIIRLANPSDGQLLHVANAAASGDVSQSLKRAGFRTLFAPLYQANPVASLSPEAQMAVEGYGPSVVAIHSAKGAAAFRNAASDLDVSRHVAVGVSDKAVKAVLEMGFRTVAAAQHPNEDSLLEMIAAVRATL
ncbi:MAG: uroporphyrinogen-III synthase [Pseudomonadota bacterium]